MDNIVPIVPERSTDVVVSDWMSGRKRQSGSRCGVIDDTHLRWTLFPSESGWFGVCGARGLNGTSESSFSRLFALCSAVSRRAEGGAALRRRGRLVSLHIKPTCFSPSFKYDVCGSHFTVKSVVPPVTCRSASPRYLLVRLNSKPNSIQNSVTLTALSLRRQRDTVNTSHRFWIAGSNFSTHH